MTVKAPFRLTFALSALLAPASVTIATVAATPKTACANETCISLRNYCEANALAEKGFCDDTALWNLQMCPFWYPDNPGVCNIFYEYDLAGCSVNYNNHMNYCENQFGICLAENP